MKYIYFKGLINKKRLFIMFLSLFIFLIILLFLFGYANVVNRKTYDIETDEESRTVYFNSSDFDVSEFTDVLEDYINYDEFYSLVFINYEELQRFKEENSDVVDISNYVVGYNEKMLYLFRMLKVSSYILSILFIIVIIIFQIHFISSSKKEIKLYHIMGLPIRKLVYIFNGLISLFFIILSIVIYMIVNCIKTNILFIGDLIIVIIIFLLAFLITSIIVNLLYLNKYE